MTSNEPEIIFGNFGNNSGQNSSLINVNESFRGKKIQIGNNNNAIVISKGIKVENEIFPNDVMEKYFERRTNVAENVTNDLSDYYEDFDKFTSLMRMGMFLKAVLTGHYNNHPEFVRGLEKIKTMKLNNAINNVNRSNIPNTINKKVLKDYIYLYDKYVDKIMENDLETGDLPSRELNRLLKEVVEEFRESSASSILNNTKNESNFLEYKGRMEDLKILLSDFLDYLIKNAKSKLAGHYIIYTIEKDGKKRKYYKRLFDSKYNTMKNEFGNSPTNSIVYRAFINENSNENEEVGKKRMLDLKRFLKTAKEKRDKYMKTANFNRWNKVKNMVEKDQKTVLYDFEKNKEFELPGKIQVKEIIHTIGKKRRS